MKRNRRLHGLQPADFAGGPQAWNGFCSRYVPPTFHRKVLPLGFTRAFGATCGCILESVTHRCDHTLALPALWLCCWAWRTAHTARVRRPPQSVRKRVIGRHATSQTQLVSKLDLSSQCSATPFEATEGSLSSAESDRCHLHGSSAGDALRLRHSVPRSCPDRAPGRFAQFFQRMNVGCGMTG